MTPNCRVLTAVVCGAGPAAATGTLIELARDRDWKVQVVATPAALKFFGEHAVADQTGQPVRSQYAKPCAPRSPGPGRNPGRPGHLQHDLQVGPGVSDTYALGVLAEAAGQGVPVVVLPFVNTALASRAPFRRSVESLRAEGVKILLGPDGFQPYPPRTGEGLIESYPWYLGLDEAERMLVPAPPSP